MKRGDARLRVVLGGPERGRRVLLVHGSQGHAGVWTPVLPALREAGLRTASLDQRGHGASSRHDRYLVDDYVDDLVAVLEELGPSAVVGHSMGGLNAILAAARRPGLVAALVHVDIDPRPPAWQVEFLHEQGAKPIRSYESEGQAVAHLLSRLAPGADPDRVRPALRAGLTREPDGRVAASYDPATLRDFGPYDVRPRLRELRLRVLVLRGEDSTVMTAQGEDDFRAVPRVRIETIGGQHHPFWDDPDAFSSRVLAFLGG